MISSFFESGSPNLQGHLDLLATIINNISVAAMDECELMAEALNIASQDKKSQVSDIVKLRFEDIMTGVQLLTNGMNFQLADRVLAGFVRCVREQHWLLEKAQVELESSPHRVAAGRLGCHVLGSCAPGHTVASLCAKTCLSEACPVDNALFCMELLLDNGHMQESPDEILELVLQCSGSRWLPMFEDIAHGVSRGTYRLQHQLPDLARAGDQESALMVNTIYTLNTRSDKTTEELLALTNLPWQLRKEQVFDIICRAFSVLPGAIQSRKMFATVSALVGERVSNGVPITAQDRDLFSRLIEDTCGPLSGKPVDAAMVLSCRAMVQRFASPLHVDLVNNFTVGAQLCYIVCSSHVACPDGFLTADDFNLFWTFVDAVATFFTAALHTAVEPNQTPDPTSVICFVASGMDIVFGAQTFINSPIVVMTTGAQFVRLAASCLHHSRLSNVLIHMIPRLATGVAAFNSCSHLIQSATSGELATALTVMQSANSASWWTWAATILQQAASDATFQLAEHDRLRSALCSPAKREVVNTAEFKPADTILCVESLLTMLQRSSDRSVATPVVWVLVTLWEYGSNPELQQRLLSSLPLELVRGWASQGSLNASEALMFMRFSKIFVDSGLKLPESALQSVIDILVAVSPELPRESGPLASIRNLVTELHAAIFNYGPETQKKFQMLHTMLKELLARCGLSL